MATKPTKSASEQSPALTEEQIAKLKTKHGKIFSYTTADGKVAYFRKPTRQDIAAAAVFANGDQLGYRGTLADNCFIAGDREIIDADEYFLAIQQKVESMITIVDGELKEL